MNPLPTAAETPEAPEVKTARRRRLPQKQVLFVLKTLNLAVITVYSFALVYVLVRVLSLALYPTAVIMSSIGAYVMATDLGYSGFLYYRLRQSFLKGSSEDHAVSEVLTLYGAVAFGSALLMAAALMLLFDLPDAARAGLSVYFLSLVMALPWVLLRRVAAAVDLFLPFEAYELVRRVFFLVLALAMLAGLPFLAFSLICLLAWAVAFAAVFRLLRSRGIHVRPSAPPAILRHLRQNWRDVGHSGALTVIEFAIYNSPYLAIPFLFHDKITIVAFDVFYKVVRFGGVAYGVPAETLLPSQTRAYYAGDRRGVMRTFYANLLLGAVPLAAAAALVLLFGNTLFTILLSKSGIVDESIRIAMVVMLAAMLFQNSAGTFLLSTGNYRPLSRIALLTMILVGTAMAATWIASLPFETFMFAYVGIYCLHAILYSLYLPRFLARPRASNLDT